MYSSARWQDSMPSADNTHHILEHTGKPLYSKMFMNGIVINSLYIYFYSPSIS